MHAAIETRYHGPTNTLPARISVTAKGHKRRYYAWSYDLGGVYQNHEVAAIEYANAHGIPLPLTAGEGPKGYIFVAGQPNIELKEREN
jgi:hypothetical protein